MTFQPHGSKIHGWKVPGWKVHGWKIWGWKVRGWSLGLKSSGLRCPSTFQSSPDLHWKRCDRVYPARQRSPVFIWPKLQFQINRGSLTKFCSIFLIILNLIMYKIYKKSSKITKKEIVRNLKKKEWIRWSILKVS